MPKISKNINFLDKKTKKNKIFKKITLNSKKEFLIWGFHSIIAALENPERKIGRIYLTRFAEKKFLTYLNKFPYDKTKNFPNYKFIEADEMNELVKKENKFNSNHQGIIAYIKRLKEKTLEHYFIKINKEKNEKHRILLLDNVTDFGNIASITRSAFAFEMDAIVINKRTFDNENGNFSKISVGTSEKIPFIKVTNIARSLDKFRENGFTIVGFDNKGNSKFSDLKNNDLIVLILGSEGKGMRRLTKNLCDFTIPININKNCESLNVAVAASIAMHEIYNFKY